MTPEQELQIQAAAWRKLVSHFQKRTDVQNIELMNMAGFCRNCMAKWLLGGADDAGVKMDYEQAREQVYGMGYGEWKNRYQQQATPQQIARFNALGEDQITR